MVDISDCIYVRRQGLFHWRDSIYFVENIRCAVNYVAHKIHFYLVHKSHTVEQHEFWHKLGSNCVTVAIVKAKL